MLNMPREFQQAPFPLYSAFRDFTSVFRSMGSRYRGGGGPSRNSHVGPKLMIHLELLTVDVECQDARVRRGKSQRQSKDCNT